MTANSITLEGVGHWYRAKAGSLEVLSGIDLRTRPDEFVAVVGPSGCGKSTLLRIVAGLAAPTSGRVLIGSKPVHGPHPGAGVVFQHPTLLPWRDVVGNIAIQLEMRGLNMASYRSRIGSLIELTGLAGFESSLPHQLSGGMQQRVSLCRALVHDPQLLLMDEPFGALDAMTREQMNLELQRVWMSRRKSVLFITHSISEAVFLADRVVVMTPRPGRIAQVIEVDLPRPRDFNVFERREFTSAMKAVRRLLDAHAMTE